MTVAELIERLQAMPGHLPVLAGVGFDNDTGLHVSVNVGLTTVDDQGNGYYTLDGESFDSKPLYAYVVGG